MELPQGILIIIGGNVNLPSEAEELGDQDDPLASNMDILNRFTDSLKGENDRIEVIPTASNVPERSGQDYVDAFHRIGYSNVGVLDIREREEANDKACAERIRNAEGVLFTGGNQLNLTSILGGSEMMDLLFERYQKEHFVIAGTSAGAMAMSDTMIYGGVSHEALLKGEVYFSSGFSFLNNIIIDTHFVKRGRIGRLFQAVASNPAALGIGLGEDTGLLISGGDIKESIGSGLVIIVDGYGIKHTNFAQIEQGEPISIEGLSVHVMVPGDKFILSERKFVHQERKASDPSKD